MSKKIKGLFMSLLLLASVLVPSLGSLGTVKADEVKDTVDITVHKRLFGSDVANNIQNTGNEMEFEGEALPNIQFTLYDVTEKYTEELKKDGVDAQEATENLVTYYSNKENKPAGDGVAQGTTDNEGNVTLSNIAKKDADGNFKTYLLLETKKPSAIKTESAPIILTMPMYRYDDKGQVTTDELANIHIYPKNVEDKDDKGENVGGKLTKELVTKIPHNTTWNSSLNAVNGNLVLSPRVGRLLEYKVTYNVPATTTFEGDAETGKGIEIIDDPGMGLVLPSKVVKDAKGNVDNAANFDDTIVDTLKSSDVVDNVTVTSNVKGLEKINGKVTYTGEKETENSLFTLKLKGDAYKNLAGEKITITYYAYLAMRNTTLDNPIDNEVTAKADTTVGPQTSTDGNARLVENGAIATLHANKPVAVGAVNFKKVDAQSGKALAGAEFVIYCEHAKGFVKFETVESNDLAGTRTALKFVSDPNNAKVFKSGEDGTFKAEYLPYSTEYKLVETKAPEGYVKGEDVQFTVAQGTKDETKVVEVKNVKKGILPSTGGMGIYLFLALGVALMGGAYVWFKKARKNENV